MILNILQKGATYGDYMERKYLKDLIEWNNDEDRKPLLVLGARQVGKTYLIKDMFAEQYYKNLYLRIDCSTEKLKTIFFSLKIIGILR